jgi:hypothetical protein
MNNTFVRLNVIFPESGDYIKLIRIQDIVCINEELDRNSSVHFKGSDGICQKILVRGLPTSIMCQNNFYGDNHHILG